MPTLRWSSILLSLLAVTLGGSTCNRRQDEVKPPTLTADATATVSPAPAAPAAAPSEVLGALPGMDFSSLPAPLQKELANVLTDEFCYCGCPHTLVGCLKTHTGCRHAKRATQLSVLMLRDGAMANDVIVSLSKYYQSFRAPRVTLQPDARMCMGAADAKITLVEFSDFECPYCAAARPVLEELAKKNTNVRLCYGPFPLPGHAHAMRAGQAALFARDGGKFWQVHDALFENQMSLSPELIRQLVQRAGLDAAEFDKAVAKDKYIDELNTWKASGKGAGVDSTPALFVNGRKLTLPISPEVLAHTLEDELESLTNNGAWSAD